MNRIAWYWSILVNQKNVLKKRKISTDPWKIIKEWKIVSFESNKQKIKAILDIAYIYFNSYKRSLIAN